MGKKLFNLYFYPNLGNGIMLNMWILSIHIYLICLFFTASISILPKILFGTCHFPDLRSCKYTFLLCAYFSRRRKILSEEFVTSPIFLKPVKYNKLKLTKDKKGHFSTLNTVLVEKISLWSIQMITIFI